MQRPTACCALSCSRSDGVSSWALTIAPAGNSKCQASPSNARSTRCCRSRRSLARSANSGFPRASSTAHCAWIASRQAWVAALPCSIEPVAASSKLGSSSSARWAAKMSSSSAFLRWRAWSRVLRISLRTCSRAASRRCSCSSAEWLPVSAGSSMPVRRNSGPHTRPGAAHTPCNTPTSVFARRGQGLRQGRGVLL